MTSKFNSIGPYKQKGWRASNADELLYTPLFRFGYVEGMHLISHGDSVKKWTNFNLALHDKETGQDGFRGEEVPSFQSIQAQWKQRITKFKTVFGWEDGHTGNLSDMNGDMIDPDKTIKLILTEQWDKEQIKKTIEADKALVEKSEATVLLSNLSKQSKKRRQTLDDKYSTPTDDTNTDVNSTTSSVQRASYTSTPDDMTALNDGITALTRGIKGNSPEKKLKKSQEYLIEEKLVTYLGDKSKYYLYLL